MSAQLSVGVDLGGTFIKASLVDEKGRVVVQHKAATHPERGVDAVTSTIVDLVRQLLATQGLAQKNLNGLGVGVPGTADGARGVVLYAPNLFWRDVPIGERLSEVFALPIFVAQDTRAAAWAEYLVGEARGALSLASVTLGTGIGCGLVFEGHIFNGGLNTAGEFGHQLVALDGEACNCGRRGCLEAHAGGLAIVREARRRIPCFAEKGKRSAEEITVDAVYRLAAVGDPEARKLTDEVVRHVGTGLVNLIDLTGVEWIFLSGGISNAPRELLFDPLVEFVREHSYPGASDRVHIARSSLGDQAPAIGAALLYRSSQTVAAQA